MKKPFLLALAAMLIIFISAPGQQNNQCALAVIAEVIKIGEQDAPSGRTANYRMAGYSVVEVIKGQLSKKEINVSHLILTGRELDELRVGDKVLLCLNKPLHVSHKKGRTVSYGMSSADYEGDLLMVDSGKR